MSNNGSIFIFSGPIRSGKTTRLQAWLAKGIAAAGILSPDVQGIRVLHDIKTGRSHTFEVNDTYGGEAIVIGKFRFAKAAFARAQEIIGKAVRENPEWLIIDEVGKLEIGQGEGLEPAVLQTVAAYQNGRQGKLLLVVRDSLLEQALRKYDLYGCHIINQDLPL